MKLRFIQKKVNLHALDIWNVIEAFREQGLHALEPNSELSVARLETLLCSLYHSLNKRAPPTQQAHVDVCSSLLLNWLLAAYATVDNVGKIRVFSIKVALATLCAGKLMDKLRYIFSQISDSNGFLLMWRFNEYLQEVLALAAAVYESPSFSYTDTLASSVFNSNAKVTVNDFLDTMMSDPGPPSLVWLPLLHRLASVENVIHPCQCDACQRENFSGFRYRCQKCPHYTLCQDCFWKGHVSGSHTLDHPVKEYSSFSPSKTIGHSLRKSFRCVPDKQKNNLPRFPEQPEKTLDLSHIVPPSPLPSHNGFPDSNFLSQFDGMGSLDSRSTAKSLDSARDDEHRLIARYAAKLAQESRSAIGRAPSETCLGMDSTRAQRELINQLEAKNREIMREIARLRRQQEIESTGHGNENPALMNELRALRMRKDELETHLTTLQDSRRQLMIQLEGLMKMLKNHQSSPRSTPNSSPRSTKSPPIPPSPVPPSNQGCPRSAPQTPLGLPPTTTQPICAPLPINQNDRSCHIQLTQSVTQNLVINSTANMHSERNDRTTHSSDSFNNVGGDIRTTLGSSPNVNIVSGNSNGNGTPGSVGRSLRNDLLVAADSVTNAMSTLVRELNSDFEDDGEDESDGGWQQELQRRYAQEVNFMAELQARNLAHSPESNNQSICQNYVNQDTNQSFSASNVINNGGQNYGGPHAYPHHKYMGHLASQMQSPFNPQLNESHQTNGKTIDDSQNLNNPDPSSEIKSKETLEWEEALKNWVNR
ncbi:Zinc finger, ZZ type [Popillia japonica]|uniref:Zinc finger, ZZ type n=1 Tax=Popillia japonica TaxID=7064 RepID=A0AAW1JUI3_POPJA